MLLVVVWKIKGYRSDEIAFFFKSLRSLFSKATNSANLLKQVTLKVEDNLWAECFGKTDKKIEKFKDNTLNLETKLRANLCVSNCFTKFSLVRAKDNNKSDSNLAARSLNILAIEPLKVLKIKKIKQKKHKANKISSLKTITSSKHKIEKKSKEAIK